jgi:hypothetical protein
MAASLVIKIIEMMASYPRDIRANDCRRFHKKTKTVVLILSYSSEGSPALDVFRNH